MVGHVQVLQSRCLRLACSTEVGGGLVPCPPARAKEPSQLPALLCGGEQAILSRQTLEQLLLRSQPLDLLLQARQLTLVPVQVLLDRIERLSHFSQLSQQLHPPVKRIALALMVLRTCGPVFCRRERAQVGKRLTRGGCACLGRQPESCLQSGAVESGSRMSERGSDALTESRLHFLEEPS